MDYLLKNRICWGYNPFTNIPETSKLRCFFAQKSTDEVRPQAKLTFLLLLLLEPEKVVENPWEASHASRWGLESHDAKDSGSGNCETAIRERMATNGRKIKNH